MLAAGSKMTLSPTAVPSPIEARTIPWTAPVATRYGADAWMRNAPANSHGERAKPMRPGIDAAAMLAHAKGRAA